MFLSVENAQEKKWMIQLIAIEQTPTETALNVPDTRLFVPR
jgi:hypothetical protein